MKMTSFKWIVPAIVLTTVACDDDDPMNPGPNPAEIPVVAGFYAFNANIGDPTCTETVPHPEVLDGPAISTGTVEVKQTGGSIDMEIVVLDGDTLSAADADLTSFVGTIDTTGTGNLTRMLSIADTANDGTPYFVDQDLAATVGFTGAAPITVTTSLTFTSEYRPDSATAPILATCTTTGTITGTSQ